jgi:hypothetical protein
MDNIYDILNRFNTASQPLMEGRGTKPDFLDLDRDGNRTEPMKAAAKEVDEASYSAKAARAGRDIGKPGKNFEKIARSAGERYGSKERGEKVAGAVLAKLRAKESVGEADMKESGIRDDLAYEIKMILNGALGGTNQTDHIIDELGDIYYDIEDSGDEIAMTAYYMMNDAIDQDIKVQIQMARNALRLLKGKAVNKADMDESALQAYLGKKKYGEEGMKALQKAGREGAGKEKMASIRSKYDKMDEAEVGEGNDFTGARLAAIKAGKPTFRVDGKVYKVTGDTKDEKVMEKKEKTLFPGTPEYEKRFPKELRPGERAKSSTGGTIEKTATGVKHTARYDDETDTDDDKLDRLKGPKIKGRPKGSKRAIGAKVKGTSKLHSKPAIKETDLEEDYDKDEYDEEGEMAQSQARTIEDAARELQSILDADENLPEWVQKKITLAMDYIDTARDYLVANRPGDTMMAEKAVSRAQRAAAGIARAAQKGEIPKSELRGASKEMARMPAGELKKFAKTKEKGLPEKVKKDESVEENTVAGSVAPSMEAPKGKKGGMIFGKGVYEGRLEESYKSRLETMLTEGMSINMSVGEDGRKNLSVSATDDDAVKLAQILKLAGMQQSKGYDDACPTCGAGRGMCEHEVVEEADLANSADDTVYADTDYMTQTLAGGLNGPKLQVNPNNPADNPLSMRKLGQHSSSSLNLGSEADNLKEETERRLMDLYKEFQTK